MALSLIAFVPTTRATTVDPMLWEQLVTSADFVGVVECRVSGGIVAKYKVIETWKGTPKKNQTVSIRVAVNYWEPQFPITLCGDKYIVTAYNRRVPSTIMSTTSGGGVPLWWRDIPADYRLPLFQGRVLLSDGKTEFFDSPYNDIATFQDAVLKLTSMTPEKIEAHLLRVLCDKYIFQIRQGDRRRDIQKTTLSPELAFLRGEIEKAKSTTSILSVLLKAANDDNILARRVLRVLEQGGGYITLKTLEKLTEEDLRYYTSRDLKYTIKDIRRRLEPRVEKGAEHVIPPEQPSPDMIKQFRVALDEGLESRRFWEAFEKLTLYDSEYVAKYLYLWSNPKKSWRDSDQGYVLGSYFGWKCGKNRKKNLTTLVEANNDFIRVAGAVYLTFEDAELGERYLRELTELKGDPGVWAALNLVRRGEKSAMPRALEVLDTIGQGGMAGVPHGNLQKRLLVLLYNSCKAGQIDKPDVRLVPDPDYFDGDKESLLRIAKDIRERNLVWWNEHQDIIRINDPWFNDLRERKID